MRVVSLSIVLIVLSFAGILYAHGEVDERIHLLSGRISQDPGNAHLYLQRGELNRELGHLSQAFQDCSRARKFDPELNEAVFCRGAVLLEMGQPHKAITEFDLFLKSSPEHLACRLRRASALSMLGKYRLAIEDFQFILKRNPSPEVYLETARTILRADSYKPEGALQIIEEGLLRVGPVVTLQEFALDLYLDTKQYDRAVALLDQILSTTPRKERRLLEKGNILLRLNRLQEACTAFKQGRETLFTSTSLRQADVKLQLELDVRLQQCTAETHDAK